MINVKNMFIASYLHFKKFHFESLEIINLGLALKTVMHT